MNTTTTTTTTNDFAKMVKDKVKKVLGGDWFIVFSDYRLPKNELRNTGEKYTLDSVVVKDSFFYDDEGINFQYDTVVTFVSQLTGKILEIEYQDVFVDTPPTYLEFDDCCIYDICSVDIIKQLGVSAIMTEKKILLG